jgi:murein DD-endopeptidase MepM/ murein hydrolase activator NlpD
MNRRRFLGAGPGTALLAAGLRLRPSGWVAGASPLAGASSLARALPLAGASPLAFATPAGAGPRVLVPDAAIPGGIVRVSLGSFDAAPRAMAGGRRVLVLRDGGDFVAVLGIGLDQPPGSRVALTVKPDAGAVRSIEIPVLPKEYATQHLTVAPGKVDLSDKDLARHQRERKHLDQVLKTFSAKPPPTLALRQPVPGRRSSSFGLRRVFNGQARSPHGGMDIAAPTGTPIAVAASGRVIDAGDYFFSGRTVIVDHGQGLLTLYAHLHRAHVAVGARLAEGATLGEVGATGRVTGPHLHFTVYLNNVAVDPALLLPPAEAS